MTDYETERARLRERARTAESPEERREAILRLVAIDRERHAEIYEKLARE